MKKTRLNLQAEVKAEWSGLIDSWLITFYTPWCKIDIKIHEIEITGYDDLSRDSQMVKAIKIAKEKIEKGE